MSTPGRLGCIIILRSADEQKRWERCAGDVELMVPGSVAGMIDEQDIRDGMGKIPALQGWGEFLPFMEGKGGGPAKFVAARNTPDNDEGYRRVCGFILGPVVDDWSEAEAEVHPWSLAVDEILGLYGFYFGAMPEPN